jgi:hypothetical protein
MNTARQEASGGGTQTAALTFGGYTPNQYLLLRKNMMASTWATNQDSLNQLQELTI